MELDLSFPSMQPIVVSVLVSIVLAGLAGCVLAWPWHVLHRLIIDGDSLSQDLFS